MIGGDAWTYIAGYLETLEQAASDEAVLMQAEVDEAEKAALELSKIDWERLKQ